MKQTGSRGRGRPPKVGGKAMLRPITVRFPEPMMRAIEEIVASRPMEQPEKGQIVRELIAEALAARATKTKRASAG
ncbi:hypothetical protein DLM45_10955 [Hyphomicrobium methylovorum]|nr:hypothetical protein [Hyphomicrobium methylovorum]